MLPKRSGQSQGPRKPRAICSHDWQSLSIRTYAQSLRGFGWHYFGRFGCTCRFWDARGPWFGFKANLVAAFTGETRLEKILDPMQPVLANRCRAMECHCAAEVGFAAVPFPCLPILQTHQRFNSYAAQPIPRWPTHPTTHVDAQGDPVGLQAPQT